MGKVFCAERTDTIKMPDFLQISSALVPRVLHIHVMNCDFLTLLDIMEDLNCVAVGEPVHVTHRIGKTGMVESSDGWAKDSSYTDIHGVLLKDHGEWRGIFRSRDELKIHYCCLAVFGERFKGEFEVGLTQVFRSEVDGGNFGNDASERLDVLVCNDTLASLLSILDSYEVGSLCLS